MEAALHNQQLYVEGVRCARCIHAIESALQSEPTVTNARLNMSTNRLSVSWQGDASLLQQLIQRVESLGYHVKPFEAPKTTRDEPRDLLRCMVLAGFAMGNLMLISVSLWSSEAEVMGLATRELLHWLSALIALPTILIAGRPFFASAAQVLRKGHTNMDVPISLALVLASGMSVFETMHQGEHAYFDSAVMLLFFLLIGRWLDARARGKARENAEMLLAMMQGYATVLDDDGPRTVPIAELQEGMTVRIAAGENIPTDAVVISGTSDVDTSLVTGETLPRNVAEGALVFGGTVNLSASLTCRVAKASDDSLLADIIRLMEQAEQGRARYVRLADKAARLYTPVVHSLALGAFLGWYFVGGMAWQEALLIAITTLIITCPCALGLAVPVVQVLASSWLMKRGILLKSGDALERLSRIDTVVFDKTGTLTRGKAELVGQVEPAYMKLAASLASHSTHPFSRAIASQYQGELLALEEVREIPGVGLEALLDGASIRLGKPQDVHNEAQVALYVEGEVQTVFELRDALREDAQAVVSLHQAAGHQTVLLSGDRVSAVWPVARELNIEEWRADILPADKTEWIRQCQQDGHHVLMVGDGLNDAPSLAQADISISPASGVDITQNSADIVFQGDQLAPIWYSWRMARLSTQLVKQNFALAVLYNCFAIPLALMGLVTPLVAAIAMSASSLVVVANSFRINLPHNWEKQ